MHIHCVCKTTHTHDFVTILNCFFGAHFRSICMNLKEICAKAQKTQLPMSERGTKCVMAFKTL